MLYRHGCYFSTQRQVEDVKKEIRRLGCMTRCWDYKGHMASEVTRNAMSVGLGRKIYPNEPCPCGSGKKYKRCCGRKGWECYNEIKWYECQKVFWHSFDTRIATQLRCSRNPPNIRNPLIYCVNRYFLIFGVSQVQKPYRASTNSFLTFWHWYHKITSKTNRIYIRKYKTLVTCSIPSQLRAKIAFGDGFGAYSWQNNSQNNGSWTITKLTS